MLMSLSSSLLVISDTLSYKIPQFIIPLLSSSSETTLKLLGSLLINIALKSLYFNLHNLGITAFLLLFLLSFSILLEYNNTLNDVSIYDYAS